jgi:hypothetical protein
LKDDAMSRFLIGLVLVSILFGAASDRALGQSKKVEVAQTWSGSVEDDKAMQPECITTSKGLTAVWKAWKADGDVPQVDFTKNIVVAVYSLGSNLEIDSIRLDDKGNLEVVGVGTDDSPPGFRYVLGVVPKVGVKTVNKRPLPKE